MARGSAFFFPREGAFDAAWMHVEVQLLAQSFGQRLRMQPWLFGLLLLDECHDLVG